MKLRTKMIIAMLPLFLITSCASKKVEVVVNTKEELTVLLSDNKFIMDSVNNEKILYRKGVNITFKTKKQNNFVSGGTGCNRFFGNYEVEDDLIRFKNIEYTKKKCLNKNDEAQEKIIVSMLESDLSVKIKANGFSFFNINNELHFKNYKK